jgi:cell division protein FtsQ
LRRSKRIALTVLMVVLMIALLFVVYQLFLVRGIIVTSSASHDYVVSLSGIEMNQSVFFVDEEKAFEQIDAEPWLEAIEVKVKYPDQVLITAELREIAAYVDKGDDFLAIDTQGVLLRIVPEADASLPVVYGLQMDKFEVGKPLGALDPFVLAVVGRLLAELENSNLDIASIDVSLAANIILVTRQGIEIEIGDDTQLSAKFNLAANSLLWLQEQEKTSGILDVSSVSKAYYLEN